MDRNKTSHLVRFIDPTALARFIVFPIANHHFALPIGQVLRVVSHPALSRHIDSNLGLIQIDRYLIKIIDLQREFDFKQSAFPPRSLLVITRDSCGALYGIPVCKPPDLLEVAPAQVQRLPEPTAYSSPAEIISSAVILSQPVQSQSAQSQPAQSQSAQSQSAQSQTVLSQQKPTPTIFLLDLQRALARGMADPSLSHHAPPSLPNNAPPPEYRSTPS